MGGTRTRLTTVTWARLGRVKINREALQVIIGALVADEYIIRLRHRADALVLGRPLPAYAHERNFCRRARIIEVDVGREHPPQNIPDLLLVGKWYTEGPWGSTSVVKALLQFGMLPKMFRDICNRMPARPQGSSDAAGHRSASTREQ